MDWKAKFNELEEVSRQLEPGSAVRSEYFAKAGKYSESFLEQLPDGQTFLEDSGQCETLDGSLSEHPTEMDDLLQTLSIAVDQTSINPASGGHLGYIPGGGIYPSAIGDFLADVTNRYSGVHFANPGAAMMEKHLVKWMCDLIGYPDTAGGDLTSGGSTANLSGIVTAREAKGIGVDQIRNSCIYMSRQVHHCVDKALRVAGLEECQLRFVPMDDAHRMDAEILEEMVVSDKAKGLNPWLLIASAGTTDTGAVDPLLKIGAIAEQHDLWLHVDAAYGGFFILCAEGREALVGLGKADSIVMDPHKGLFLPYGTGAVLVKNVDLLARAHSYHANYMQDANDKGFGYSPADLSVELSRPFRGLRLWLPLKLFGLAAYRSALEEKIWLARYFHSELSKVKGFAVGANPDLSVVTFKYEPVTGDIEKFNRRLLKAVHDDGRIFISSTMLDGQFTLRVAILHLRTHLEEVDYLLKFLTTTAAALDT
ncbi:MAG: aromatic-L-amino-acid decarboxylase [Lysobacterales bacterium]|jgi:aromatic-L-amino-acid decarboxylase